MTGATIRRAVAMSVLTLGLALVAAPALHKTARFGARSSMLRTSRSRRDHPDREHRQGREAHHDQDEQEREYIQVGLYPVTTRSPRPRVT